jgi:aldehyde:ferredoxin oxidoreductase
LDFSSTGNIIGFLMDLYHRGIITEKDTDGIPMRRGDKDAVISTIHKIAQHEGFGKLFRDGVLQAAKTVGKGAEEYATHVKQLEMQAYEYRAYKGVALAAAVASKDQLEALPVFEYGRYDPGRPEEWAEELYGTKKAANPPSYEKKALSVWDFENRYAVMDMLGVCKFFLAILTPYLEIPAQLFSLATGVDTSEDELLRSAQRVRVLERAFDVMRGVRRKHDTLPKRMFEEAVPGGRFRGERLDKEKFDRMVDEYYALCGWDGDGIPTEETFNTFGLSSEWQAFQKKIIR